MEYIIKIVGVYMIVIVGIIGFSVFSTFKETFLEKKRLAKKKMYTKVIHEMMRHFKESDVATKEHILFLKKELSQVDHLFIFEEVMSELKEKDENLFLSYCHGISSAFQDLAIYYRRKGSFQKAYFTHVLSLFPELIENDANDSIRYAMMHFIMDDSVYCRENAMLFFYQKDSAKLVVNSLKKISNRNLYYSPKLLADDLFKFTGNQSELIDLLLQEFDKFNANFQMAIITYIRFCNEDRREEIYQKLKTKKYHKEVQLSILRYFAKHKYHPIVPVLLEELKDKKESRFEYRLVAAFALGSYDNNKTREALIDSLSDRNYHVRKNVAISLSRMGLTKENVEKIQKIQDPYARDMLKYVWQQAGKKKSEILEITVQKGVKQG